MGREGGRWRGRQWKETDQQKTDMGKEWRKEGGRQMSVGNRQRDQEGEMKAQHRTIHRNRESGQGDVQTDRTETTEAGNQRSQFLLLWFV
jgi:hypothetical protein